MCTHLITQPQNNEMKTDKLRAELDKSTIVVDYVNSLSVIKQLSEDH